MLLPGATGGAMRSGRPSRATGLCSARLCSARLCSERLAAVLILLAALTAGLCPSRAIAQQPRDAQQLDPQALAEQAIRRLDLQTEMQREDEPEKPHSLKLPPETVWIAVAVGVLILAYAF